MRVRSARELTNWGRPVFSFDQRQIFASQIFIHRGKFLRDLFKIWEAALPADMQMTALADMIQAALMLNYNDRKVG